MGDSSMFAQWLIVNYLKRLHIPWDAAVQTDAACL